MANISPQKVEANRRNAQKSTGPRSVEGKQRARFNALKHGATAQIPVLPGEDPAYFLEQVEAYTAILEPRNLLESDLVEQAVVMKLQRDRANREDAARATERVLVQTASDLPALAREREVEALGQRLFSDCRGPTAAYPNKEFYKNQNRTSSAGVAGDPDHPVQLVKQLESTGAGCRWLLERWAELRARLETGGYWQSPDKLKAVRLLGRQPLDAADEREVTSVFLASHVLDPQPKKSAFFELHCDLDESEYKRYLDRLTGRGVDAMRPADAAAARQTLLALVDRATDRLKPLAEAHRLLDDKLAALRPHTVASDRSVEEDRLRRYAQTSHRGMLGTIDSIFKFRKKLEAAELDNVEPADDAYTSRGQWSVVSGQQEVVDSSAMNDGENEANGNSGQRTVDSGQREVVDYREDEVNYDRENDANEGERDPVREADDAYRDALEAAIAWNRDPAAGPPRINMAPLEQAILANARKWARLEDLEKEEMAKRNSGQRSAVSGQLPVVSDQLPVVSDQLPVASDQLPVVSDQLPVVSDQLPVVSDQLPVVSDQLPVVSDQLPVVSDQLPVVSDQLPVVSDQLPVVSDQLSVVSGQREVADSSARHVHENEATENSDQRSAVSSQREVADSSARHVHENEATGNSGQRPAVSSEKEVADFSATHDRGNEATDDVQDLRNLRNLEDRELLEAAEYRRAAAGLPPKRLEWYRMFEQPSETTGPE